MNKIEFGECRETMKRWAEQGVKVQMCVTSPPYYGLRDYKTAQWEGGDPNCDHVEHCHAHGGERADRDHTGLEVQYRDVCGKCGATSVDRQIGLEDTPEQYIQNMVEVFRGVRDILADDGVIWVNIGDSYYNYRGGNSPSFNKQTVAKTDQDLPLFSPSRGNKLAGLKGKDLIGIPWMLAFALRADGWYLRQDIIWNKPNPMPESVTDRCTKSHEYIFLLSKSQKYYFDNEAIKEESKDESALRLLRGVGTDHKNVNGAPGQTPHSIQKPRTNVRKEYDSSMGGGGTSFVGHSGYRKADGTLMFDGKRNKRSVWTVNTKPYRGAHFAVYPEELITPCILAGSRKGDIVFDPFMGSGTTAAMAMKLGRQYLGCELNPDYGPLQQERIAAATVIHEKNVIFDSLFEFEDTPKPIATNADEQD